MVAALDVDPLAVETYKRNHPRALILERDITKVTAKSILKRLKLRPGQLPVLAGCPPCEGFSALRTLNGRRRIRDTKNDLIFQFLRFVRVLRPKSIMLENVPGLARDRRLNKFRKVLTSLGYRSTCKVLNAVDYGVPQRRHRMILLALKTAKPKFAMKWQDRPTVGAVMRQLAKPGESGDPLHDHRATRSPKVRALIRKIPRNGGSRRSLHGNRQLDCHRRITGFNDIYGRMSWDQPAPTITSGCINPSKGRFLHPTQNRAITLREAALLQGFPKGYFFSLRRGTYPAAQMIGNAFPPQFATLHARQLVKQLRAGKQKRFGQT